MMGETSKVIAELNKAGYCTASIGGYGCACPKCYGRYREVTKLLFEDIKQTPKE